MARTTVSVVALWIVQVLASGVVPEADARSPQQVGPTPAPADSGRWQQGLFSPVPTRVNQMAVGSDGILYAIGDFSTIGDVVAPGIARWDGSVWEPLDPAVESTVSSVRTDELGSVYFVGQFTRHGETHFYARWNGAEWTALGDKAATHRKFAVSPTGVLYANNVTQNRREIEGDGVERLKEGVWSGLPGAATFVSELIAGRDENLYATWDDKIYRYEGAWNWPEVADNNVDRRYVRSVNVTATGVLRGIVTIASSEVDVLSTWNGTSWEAIPNPYTVTQIRAITVTPDEDIVVVARHAELSRILKYHVSTGWIDIGPAPEGDIRALAADDADNVFLAGRFGPDARDDVVEWTGSVWRSLIPTGDGFAVRPTAAFTDADGKLHVYVDGRALAWSDGSWAPAAFDDDLHRAPFVSGPDGMLYASERGTTTNVARWDGQKWTPLPPLYCDDGQERFYYVNTFSFAPDATLYGSARCSGHTAVISKFTGESWEIIGTVSKPPTQATIVGGIKLAFDDGGNMYAGGNFAAVEGVPAMGIAKWDGTTWSAVGSGFQSEWDGFTAAQVQTIEYVGGRLFVGGAITHSGNGVISNIAVWQDGAWARFGAGFDGTVFDLDADSSGVLFASGNFKWSGSQDTPGVARWDGAKWVGVGGGLRDGATGRARATGLVFDGENTLWVFGDFFRAGDYASRYIARWTPRYYTPGGGPDNAPDDDPTVPNEATPSITGISAAYLNPFADELRLVVTVGETAQCSISIFDALGRLLMVVHEGELTGAAEREFVVPTITLPTGVLFVRMHGSSIDATRAVIHTRR